MSAGRPSSWSSRRAATSRSISRRSASVGPVGGRLVQAPLHAGAFLGHDLVELAADVAEHVAEPVALEGLLAPPLEPVHQVAQAGQVRARRVARPPATLHQATQRLGQVALGHDVVGQRVHDLVGVEVGDVLAAVPARVPGAPGERAGSRASWPAAPDRRAERSRGSGE